MTNPVHRLKMLAVATLSNVGKLLRKPSIVSASLEINPYDTNALDWLHEKNYRSLRLRIMQAVLSDEILSDRIRVEFANSFLRNWNLVRGQLCQDLIAQGFAEACNFPRTFIEVGVGHGEVISNTYTLEKKFGWKGVLVEANSSLISGIRSRRSSPVVERACFSESGKTVNFKAEATPELSHVVEHENELSTYPVETITLNDLIEEYDLGPRVGFISIDVEGAEMDVIAGWDMDRYRACFVVIENGNDRDRLKGFDEIFSAKGYTRIGTHVSRFDTWFIAKEAIM